MLNEANQVISILLEEAAWAYKNGLDAPITRHDILQDSIFLTKQLSIQAQANDQKQEESEPVRLGRWIQVDDTKCRCSECEVITLIAQYPNGDKNYCPNCGAKMDGGAKDETHS